MQRLTGADATFLYLQSPTSHMEVACAMIIDQTGIEGGITYERALEAVEARLHLAPPFRRRLVRVPFQLDNPRWIEDPHFDIRHHLRRGALPAPGGMEELAAYAADVVGRPLDQSRPLWELHLVEGLEGGRIGVVSKTHHAAVDGISGVELIAALVDLAPDAPPPSPPAEPWQPEPVPSDARLVTHSLTTLVGQPLRGVRATQRLARALVRDQLAKRRAEVTSATDAPATVFNVGVTPHRRVAFTDVALDDVKAVRSAAAGTTVNDVVLTMCGGALRRYLTRRGALPERPLVAFVPLSTRPDDERDSLGNQVSVVFATLATHVEDPLERLQLVHRAMIGAKDQHHAVGAATLTDWTEIGGASMAAVAGRVVGRLGINQRLRSSGNVVISNIPGPPVPLYVLGGTVEAIFPIGPVADGSALNITLVSYRGRLHIGLAADRETVPDLDDLLGDLHHALDELTAATAPA